MQEKIKIFKDQINQLNISILNDIKEHFENVNYNQSSTDIQILKVRNEEDLNNILYGEGFYIILTNQEFNENKCTFEFENQKAIYRGHSYFTKKRLLSHLANKTYLKVRTNNDPLYKVCLKVEDGVNGINIDQEPYKNWQWTVIVHKMKNSSKTIREQAEVAFDELYGRPCKSKEKKRKLGEY